MMEYFRVLRLLMYKNVLVRLRHWKMTLIVEALMPIALVMMIQAARDASVRPPSAVPENAYNPPMFKHDLFLTTDSALYYTPNDTHAEEFMIGVRNCTGILHPNLRGYRNEEELLAFYTTEQATSGKEVMAVIFHESPVGQRLTYTIKHNSYLPNSLYTAQDFGAWGYDKMLRLQMCLDETFIHSRVPSINDIQLSVQKMPYPAHVQEDMTDTMMRMLICMFVVMALLIPLCVETSYSSKEKQIGVNILMYMNGITPQQNLLSWLLTGVAFSALYVIPLTVLFKNTFYAQASPYLQHGNPYLFCILLFVHVGHLYAFGTHVSAYFARPRFVTIALSMMYMGSFALQQYMIEQRAFTGLPILGIFIPNILLYRLLEEVNALENRAIGLEWRSIFATGDLNYNGLGSAGSILFLSIFGMLMHFVLANYVNALLPGKYGVPERPLYFLQFARRNRVNDDEDIADLDYGETGEEDFEAVTGGTLKPGIKVRNLKKCYKTGWFKRSEVHALRGISVDFYKDQITALLGHNGAGKTTLMSILTGVIPETNGKVIINGKSIKNHLDFIRRDLGLCPQENMFFPDLSVFEQMQFFGLLKGPGRSRREIERNAIDLLEKLKLSEKKRALPGTLSGGQKRRLCLGMALIGDSSILILDEPTSGMDPETRRDTWDILLKMRGNKTIIVSTHDMEEADILGDRIAIVHTGRLKCYGTSMFLKKQYGDGNVEVTLSTKPWSDSDKVISEFGPSAQKISVDSEKIVLSVSYTDALPKLLDGIEQKKAELCVTGIDVSLITLEQVFLKVTMKEEAEARPRHVSPPRRVNGGRLFLQSMTGLFEKKLTYVRKNPWQLSLMLLLPLIATLLVSLNTRPESYDTDQLSLRLDMYPSAKALLSVSNGGESFGEKYEEIVAALGGHVSAYTDSERNISEGLLRIGKTDITDYHNNYIVSAEFDGTPGNISANGLYSKTAVHSRPLTVNLLTNALLKTLASDEYSISISTQRFPPTLSDMREPEVIQSLATVLMFLGFFFSTLALFVVHPIEEATKTVKQLQRMTGVTSFVYWNVMLLFDLLLYLLLTLVVLCGFFAMDRILAVKLYTGVEIPLMLLILMIFGVNGILVAYIFSFIGKSKNAAQTILSLVPYALVLSQYMLEIVLPRAPYRLLGPVFRLIPHVSFFYAQLSFYGVANKNARCRRFSDDLHAAACRAGDVCCGLNCTGGKCARHLAYFGASEGDAAHSLEESLIYLAATPFLYYLVLIALEERWFWMLFARFRSVARARGAISAKMDDEVKAEKHLIAWEVRKVASSERGDDGKPEPTSGSADGIIANSTVQTKVPGEAESENLFLAYELSKRYGKLTAVKDVSFRVKERECFGLLGVNGAGKSTTFRMLTGEEPPDNGLIYLRRWEMTRDRRRCLAEMGYCPQMDALIDSLNAFDHLRLFARLRGIPSERVDAEVNEWIDRLNLHACKSQPSSTYSGGNKRRLNIAMAMIGGPTLVLLDEPTTGVDPAARRSLWSVVRSCQSAGQAIILTSHSMEECEALCNRLVIMVRGELVCVGASQELKNRFGAGYDVRVKLNPGRSNEEANAIKRSIESALACEMQDENMGLITYHVKSTETWQNMYGAMKELKNRFSCVEDYSVLSATLEQLFMQFARAAEKSENDASLESTASRTIPV